MNNSVTAGTQNREKAAPFFGDSEGTISETEKILFFQDPGRGVSSQQDVTMHPWRWPLKGSAHTDHYSCSHCCNTIS